MTTIARFARALAARTPDGIELAIEDDGGRIFKVLATDDQIDRLVDELDDLLVADTDDGDGSPTIP